MALRQDISNVINRTLRMHTLAQEDVHLCSCSTLLTLLTTQSNISQLLAIHLQQCASFPTECLAIKCVLNIFYYAIPKAYLILFK